MGVGCEGGGCGSRYADITCIICNRNETILPFMSAKCHGYHHLTAESMSNLSAHLTHIRIIIIKHMKSLPSNDPLFDT